MSLSQVRTYTRIILIFLVLWSEHSTAMGQVLNHETKVLLAENGKKETYKKIRIRIPDKSANWMASVSIPHSPKAKLVFDYANILDEKGEIIRSLKKKDLRTRNERSYQAFYQDDLVTEFDMFWSTYPYQIEYAYSIIQEEFLRLANWTPYLYFNVATLKSSLQLTVPTSTNVHIHQQGRLNKKESISSNEKKFIWESSFAGKLKNERFSPPLNEQIPYVTVVPEQFTYGVEGSFVSWESFGAWQEELNKETDQLSYSEELKVRRLLEGVDDKKTIIRLLYYYLQDHTRYINVAIDVGGLKSYPASYVCQNKYGDCKALTTYMKGLLKEAGIESFYSKIYGAENPIRVKPNFPSPQSNHVVLMVPIEEDTIWLENTSNSLPFDYVGTFIQDRYTLVVNGEKSSLLRTPKLGDEDVLIERFYEFDLSEEEHWKTNVRLKLRGAEFEYFRSLLQENNLDDQKEALSYYMNFDRVENLEWSIDSFHRDSTHLSLDITGDVPKLMRAISKWDVINPLRINMPDFESVDKRKKPVRINYPIHHSDRHIFNSDSLDQKKVTLAKNASIKSKYGSYAATWKMENKRIIVQENFLLKSQDIALDEYPQFYEFIDSINKYKKKSAILIQ